MLDLVGQKPPAPTDELESIVSKFAPTPQPLAQPPAPAQELDDIVAKFRPAPTASENLADAGRLFLQGTADVGGAIGWGLEKSGIAPEAGKTLRESAGENQERLQGRMTPEMQAASQQPLLDADNNINPNFDWRSLAANVIPSIPGSIAMGVGSAPLAGALGLAGKAAGSAIAGKAGATIGNFVGTGAGYGAGEGIFSAASNASQWTSEQEKTPTADFALKNANNPNWQAALAANNGDLEAAKASMISQGADDIFWDTAWKTGALSTVTGGGMFGGMTRRVAGETAEGFGKSIAKDFLSEAGQEAPQSYFENKTTNQAVHDYVDPTQDVNEGNLNAGALGAISGGIMGAVGGGASSLVKVRGPLTQALATNPGAIEEGLRRQEQQRLAAEAAAKEENQNGSRIKPNNSNPSAEATGQPGQQPPAGPLVGGLNNLSQPTDNGGLNARTTTNTGTTENTGLANGDPSAGGFVPTPEQEIGAATGQYGQGQPENNAAAGTTGTSGSDQQRGPADLADQDLQDTIDFLNQRRGEEQNPEALQRIDSAMSIYTNELNRRVENANTQTTETTEPLPEVARTPDAVTDNAADTQDTASLSARTQDASEEANPKDVRGTTPPAQELSTSSEDVVPVPVGQSQEVTAALPETDQSTRAEGQQELEQPVQPAQKTQEADRSTAPVAQEEPVQPPRLQSGEQSAEQVPQNATVLNRTLNQPFKTKASAQSALDSTVGEYSDVTPDSHAIQKVAGGFALVSKTQPTTQVSNEQTYQQAEATAQGSQTGSKENSESPIDAAAHQAATSPFNDLAQPTEAQKEAGNYKKGKVVVQGLNISIENPQGSERSGVSPDGKAWTTKLAHHYGYIKGTVGNDNDQVDTFIGPNPDSPHAFVVNQNHVANGKRTKKFDEHKVLLGFNSKQEAIDAYNANYEEGWQGMASVTRMSIDKLKEEVNSGKLNKPIKQDRTQMYHPAIESMANDLKEKGGVAVLPDNRRTPSVNPAWFQVGLLGREKVSVREVKEAVKAFKNGGLLKPKQERILQALSDAAYEEEQQNSGVDRHTQDLESLLEEYRQNDPDSYPSVKQAADRGKITADNIQEYWDDISALKAESGAILNSYTEGDLSAKEKEDKAREKAQADKETKAKQKAQADKEVDDVVDEFMGNTPRTNDIFGMSNPMEKPADPETHVYSKPQGVRGGLKISQVLDRLSKKQKELLENGNLEIVYTTSELPASVLGTEDKASVNFIAEGLYKGDNDKIYIVADGVTEQTLPKTLAHEAFHRALDTDKKLQAAYEKFKGTIENRFNLARDGKGSKTELEAYQRVIDSEVGKDEDFTPEEIREIELEEFMAYMITEYVNRPENFSQSVQRVIRDFLAAIKVALVRAGVSVDIMGGLKPADFAAMSRYGWNLNSESRVGRSQNTADYRQRMEGMFSAASEAARRASTEPLTKGPRPDSGVSVNVPIAVGTTKDAMKTFYQADMTAYKEDQKNYDKNTALLKTYPNFRPVKGDTNDKITARMIKHIVDNLLWLHDLEDADVRERSKKWYEGARRLADHYAQKFGISPEVAAAVIATQSPQTEWFTNISKAERIMDVWTNQQDFVWSKEMTKTAARIYGKKEFAVYIAAIKGKKLSELSDDNLQGAMWVRTYDETYNNNFFREISPEGYFLGYDLTGKGARSKNAWGSNAELAKGIAILKNPTIGQISMELGIANKVRSFYNNIIAPNSKYGDVTIDTHAGAAGWVRPLSANDEAVSHYFDGGAISVVSGNRGVYALLAEAYRQAAAQRGLLPREMQSIAWESVRGLFPDKFKAVTRPLLDVNGKQVFDKKGKKLNVKVNLEKVDAIWEKYKKGKITQEQARNEIYELATKNTGGYQKPAWYGRPSGEEYASDGDSTYSGELPSPSLSERGTRPVDTGAGRTTTRVDAEPGKFSKVKDPRKTIAKGRVQLFANGVTQTYVPILGTPKAGVKQSFRAGEELIKLARKSGVDAPIMDELVSSPANTKKFVKNLEAIKQSSKFGSSVYIYPSEKYNGMRLFLARDGKSGFALKNDSEDGKVDIVSVFSTPDAPKGRAYTMLALATQEGGNKLDAFDTVLPDIYKAAGFKESWRMAWNNKYRPEGWSEETYKAYDEGHPDVVGFNFDPKYNPFKVSKIMVSLSDSTDSIPGIDTLRKQLSDGDLSAGLVLREIGHDALEYLTSGIKSAVVSYEDATGLYGGEVEASLGLSMSFEEGDREAVLKALAKFSQNFNQEQFHILGRVEKGTHVGHVYDDGSYNSPFYRFKLNKPLGRAEIESIINESGLYGLTATDQYLDAYFVGDPNNADDIKEFIKAAKRARQSLGARSSGAQQRMERLWVYGKGGAAGSYESITGQFRPSKEDQPARTAQRIASRLAQRNIPGATQAKELTPEQTATQEQIAIAYDKLAVNNLSDPNVMRAYKELATEVLDQYASMPIKVEVWDQEGEPYSKKGVVSSKEMRQDLLQNNHIYIYKTDKDSFGPKGIDYSGHPLLEDSGITDINGTPLVYNDLLRAVHDYYAHSVTITGFGPLGEEAAWKTHMQMTKSPWAKWALTSETRGQNSWVNFRPEVQGRPLSERGFAEQKVDLLPTKWLLTGDAETDANLKDLPTKGRFSKPSRVSFYSELQRSVADDKIPKAAFQSPQNLKQWLNNPGNLGKIGVKADEVYWSGLNDWLDLHGKGPVNKADVNMFLLTKGFVKTRDVVLGGDVTDETVRDMFGYSSYEWEHLSEDKRNQEREEFYKQSNKKVNLDTKYADSDYVVPGGRAPKEIIVEAPNSESFHTDKLHYGDISDKQVAWVRLDTRSDGGGADGTFIQEIQSKRSMEGRENGFIVSENLREEAAKKISDKYGIVLSSDSRMYSSDLIRLGVSKEDADEWVKKYRVGLKINPAPWITDKNNKSSEAYIALMLKKAVAQAIEAGHSWVAWTRGDQQADFYKLSHKIKRVSAKSNNNGTYNLVVEDKSGTEIAPYSEAGKKVTKDEMSLIIGKDIAKKLVEGADQQVAFYTMGGVDLDITPNWTSSMYGDENGNDKNGKPSLIKQAAMDIAKKMGGEVGSVETAIYGSKNSGSGDALLDAFNKEAATKSKQKNPALIITPAMAEKVGREGISMFSKKKLPATININGEEKPTTNSDGQPLALTEEAVKNFYKWFGDSKVVDADGYPIRLYHGTPNDFSVFNRDYSNAESDLGAGFYFSNTTEDVGFNYAGFGSDLQNKIENLAERLQNEDDDIEFEEAFALATKQLAQHEGASMPVYLKMENPVVIGGTDETFFDYQEEYDEETEEYGEPTGAIVDLAEAIQNIDTDRFRVSIEEHLSDLYEAAIDSQGLGLGASELLDVLKKTFVYAEDYETGDLASNEIIRQLFEEMGYDGFIDNTVDQKFGSQKRVGEPMKGMSPDTVHYIVNKPNQIKSATGNTGEFSKSNTDIRYSLKKKVKDYFTEEDRTVNTLADMRQVLSSGKLPHDVQTWQSFKDKMTSILVDASRPFDAWTRMFPDQAAAGQMILSKDRAKRMTAVMEQEALQKFLTPAAEQIQKIAKKNGWDYRAVKDMVGFWMSQRYAIEKNQDFIRQDTDAANAAYNAMMADPGNAALAKAATKAYKKMHERISAVNEQREVDPTDEKLTAGLAGGYNDYTAHKMMAEIEAKIPRAALEKAAKPIYDMMQWKVQRDITNGKVTQQQVSQWFNSPYYVPLTGDPSVDTSEESLFNHGSVNQGKDKKALGRAGSISQNGIDAAVEQVQKSARYHGWKDFKDALVDMYDSLFAEEKAADPNLTDAEIEAAIMKKYKISVRQEGGPTPVSDTSIIVRKPGVAHRWGENRIYDIHNIEAVEALKSINKEDTPSVLRHVAYFTRQYSRAVTQFLPGFALINATRDTWERSENIRTRILPGYETLDMNKVGRQAIANASNPKLARKFAGALSEGTSLARKFPAKNADPDVVLLREMIANGGTSTVGDYLGATGKDLAKQMAASLGWGRNIHDAVSVWNNSFELISSFSIYKALRNSGVDAKTAAGGVLNMMNFGKQGSAMGPIKALYTFVNPTMQGGHQMIQTLSTKRGKQRAAAYLVAGMALYTMLAAFAGDDDEIGENKLFAQSNFITERNIQIPFGDDFIKIPIGFGMPQAMWSAAVNIVKMLSGNQTPGESALEIMKGVSRTLAPVAPSETSIADHPIVWLAQTFTPQIGKPLMNVGLDVNTFGGSLTNAKFFKEDVSESLQGRKSTPEFYKVLTQELAKMGIDMYPEVAKEIIRGYAVGPLNEILKAWVENPTKESLGRKTVNPLIDRFVSTHDTGSLKERLYYRYRDEMNQAGKRTSMKNDLSPKQQALIDLLGSVKKLEGRANGKLAAATKAEKAGNKEAAAGYKKVADEIRENTKTIVFRQMKKLNED